MYSQVFFLLLDVPYLCIEKKDTWTFICEIQVYFAEKKRGRKRNLILRKYTFHK